MELDSALQSVIADTREGDPDRLADKDDLEVVQSLHDDGIDHDEVDRWDLTDSNDHELATAYHTVLDAGDDAIRAALPI